MPTPDVDHELLQEFLLDLHEQGAIIEQALARLQDGPGTDDPFRPLHRAFHNLKGAAALCRFEAGVDVTHRIESLLARLQGGAIGASALLGEAIMLATDRLEQAAEALTARQPVDQLQLPALVEGIDALIASPAERIDSVAAQVIEAVTGFRPRQPGAGDGETEAAAADLTWFRRLAQQLEQRSPHFQGRTGRIRQLALAMNAAAGKPVDPMQLEAAAYLHDVGMMFLPEPLWLKPGALSDAEWAEMRQHPDFAAELLGRMRGWTEATRMVAQHHERQDGSGYPHGLKGEAICPGAKILAIVDAFEAVMLKHAYRGQKISKLRAAAEINGCDRQFAAEWIDPFNRLVRQMI
jgi:HD-GYP domain-containing protein (c-di-GMP phosphodiesterase class II)